MRVGFDVDGVIAGFADYVIDKLSLDPSKNRTWSFAESYGQEVEQQVLSLINDPATWVSLPVLDGAKVALNKLARHGIPFLFVTRIPLAFRPLREWWIWHHFQYAMRQNAENWSACGELGVPDRACIFVRNMEDKPSVFRRYRLTHAIEDNTDNARALAEVSESYLVPTRYMLEVPDGVKVATVREFANEVVRQWEQKRLTMPRQMSLLEYAHA